MDKKTTKAKFFGRSAPESGVSVSQYGFLVFENLEDFTNFHEFMLTNTHANVQTYLDELFFTSQGASMYSEVSGDTVKEEECMYYAFGADEVIQIEGVIMRPIDSDRFLLTMTPEFLDNETYGWLINGEYHGDVMSKIATNPTESTEYTFFDFINANPRDYEQTDPNSTPQSRFLGWGWKTLWLDSYIDENGCWVQYAVQVYTVFGWETNSIREKEILKDCPED